MTVNRSIILLLSRPPTRYIVNLEISYWAATRLLHGANTFDVYTDMLITFAAPRYQHNVTVSTSSSTPRPALGAIGGIAVTFHLVVKETIKLHCVAIEVTPKFKSI